MLNEPASSLDNLPVRPSSVAEPTREDAHFQSIRDKVATVFAIDREINHKHGQPDDMLARTVGSQLLMLNAESRLIASFQGKLLLESEQAYDQLDTLFEPVNHTPVFRLEDGKQVVHVLEGRVRPRPSQWWPNLLLFIATIVSVLIVGTEMAISEIASTNPFLAQAMINDFFANLWRGLPYAISIMLILGAHELGHYFAARKHRVAVTLPYFIPLPFLSPFGTLGAFIQLRQPMRNRKVLLDVGAAGPLAGLVFAIPILLIGLATSHVGPVLAGGMVEGNSILYALAKILVLGQFYPTNGQDVFVNQLAWAGWSGLLVTALNLIPLGQLDGGHVLYSLIGERARVLYLPLLAVMIVLALITQAWIVWVFLLILFGRFYAAPLDTITPLDKPRKSVAVLAIIMFVLTFVPVPFSQVEPGTPQPRNSAYVLPAVLAAHPEFTVTH